LRIGVFRDWFDDAEKPIVKHCDLALEALVARGAVICPIDTGDLELARLSHLVTIATEMTESQRPHFAKHLQDYGADTRLLFALVRSFPPTIYVAAQRIRTRVAEAFARVFQDVDVIATPSTGCLAPKVPGDALASGESNLALFDRIMRFAPIANLLGLPAISIPVGYDSGLPIGLQFMGRAYEEHALLRLAAVLQGSLQRQLPAVHYRLLS
jgi:Asp-tRNA(Asn)/Glu-tRNA(Gln) amidotransferase A subunit family amidase